MRRRATIVSGRDRASGGGVFTPVAADAGCPARARLSFSRRNERPTPTWGGPPPRSAVREVVDFVLFVVAFVVTLLLAAHVGMGRLR